MSPADQNLVISAYDHAAQSTAAYEAGPEVSPFSSKFDFALANPTSPVFNDSHMAGRPVSSIPADAELRRRGQVAFLHLVR